MITVLAEWADESRGLAVSVEEVTRYQPKHTAYRLWRQIADEVESFWYPRKEDALRAFNAVCRLLSK